MDLSTSGILSSISSGVTGKLDVEESGILYTGRQSWLLFVQISKGIGS
jgi:hypothetical protein